MGRITIKSEVYNNNISAYSNCSNVSISINNIKTKDFIAVQSSGAQGPPGVGSDPVFVADVEQRLTDLEEENHVQTVNINW